MNIQRLILATAASAVTAVPAWSANPTATASYTDTLLSSGEYQYNITLNNTGSSPIGVYWFSWVPGAGFLSPKPDDFMSPPGWTANVTNAGPFAIMWTLTSSGSPLAGGGTLSGFSFQSTETPAHLAGTVMGSGLGAGDPITTSYVYANLNFPLNLNTLTTNGTVFVTTAATSPTPSAVPEPATLALLGLGLAGLALARRKRTKN